MALRAPGEVESAAHTPNGLAASRPVQIHASGAQLFARLMCSDRNQRRAAPNRGNSAAAQSVHISPLPACEHGLRAVSRAASLSAIPQTAIADSGIAENDIARYTAVPESMGKT
jgi:hypothetical protein